ncbi:S8 family serine peptidase [Lewinella sp. LCG006]|uniref:S8 family serine peptidase n=1 Tax=Lewinella sp. LCG006 TaxID=3231911 RepID=UPI003460445A
MRSKELFSTNLDVYIPIILQGTPVYKRYDYLRNFLDQRLGVGFSSFLAIPKVKGDRGSWYAPHDSESIVLLQAATPEIQQRFRTIIANKRSAIEDLLEALNASADKASVDLVKRIQASLIIPGEDHIWVDTRSDDFFFVAWGFEYAKPKSDVPSNAKLSKITPVPPVGDASNLIQAQEKENLLGTTEETQDELATSETTTPPDKETGEEPLVTSEPISHNTPAEQVGSSDDAPGKKRNWIVWILGGLLLLALLLIFSLFWRKDDQRLLSPIDTILPEQPDVLPPIDTTKIIIDEEDPLKQVIVANRLNIYLVPNTDLPSFSQQLKNIYPSPEIKIVYYTEAANRLMLECPSDQRTAIKAAIEQMKHVQFVMDETVFGTEKTLPVFNDPGLKEDAKAWPLEAIQLFDAWKITKGDPNVIIAVIDDGFDLKHSEFLGQYIHPWNIPGGNNNTNTGLTSMFHGTHVAGIAGARSNNAVGTAGVAPGCKIMPIQVGNPFGIMTTSAIVDGLFYALNHGADVINLSLGSAFTSEVGRMPISEQERLAQTLYPQQEKFWTQLFKLLYDKGVVVVQAAGNADILASIDPMQRNPYTIKVTATDKGNKKAGFSNFGKNCQLSAPGTKIFSTIPRNGYNFLDGTSMAAPIVSGAVALLKSNNPNITPQQCVDILYNTGLEVGPKIGRLIQLADALGYDGAESLPCQEEINRLKEELKRLREILQDSNRLGLIIPEDPEDLSFAEGIWKSSTDLMSSLSGEKLELYFKFNKDGSGELTILETDGDQCKAPLKVNLYPNKMEIDQLTDAKCKGSDPDYSPYSIRCISNNNQVAICRAVNKTNKSEVEFQLIKVQGY